MSYRGHIPGPNGEHLALTTVTPQQLQAAQEQERKRIEAAIQKREQQEAEHKATLLRREAEAGQAELDRYEQQARAAWLSSGGDAAGFAKAWPDMKQRYLVDKAHERLTRHDRLVEQEKAALRRRYGA